MVFQLGVRGGRHRHNSWQHLLFGVEPMAGIEPATDGLRNRCSTTELHWLFKVIKDFLALFSLAFLSACIVYGMFFPAIKITLPSQTKRRADVDLGQNTISKPTSLQIQRYDFSRHSPAQNFLARFEKRLWHFKKSGFEVTARLH